MYWSMVRNKNFFDRLKYGLLYRKRNFVLKHLIISGRTIEK